MILRTVDGMQAPVLVQQAHGAGHQQRNGHQRHGLPNAHIIATQPGNQKRHRAGTAIRNNQLEIAVIESIAPNLLVYPKQLAEQAKRDEKNGEMNAILCHALKIFGMNQILGQGETSIEKRKNQHVQQTHQKSSVFQQTLYFLFHRNVLNFSLTDFIFAGGACTNRKIAQARLLYTYC